MKAIVCELCEGREFTKQDGMFICQGCGTRYTPDEAKAMMKEIEGEAVVTPVAKSNADLEKYLLLARRAKDSGNSADAAKYYGMAEAEDPNNWESSFYSVYFTAMQTNIAGISSAAILVTNCLPSVIDLIKNHTPAEEQLHAVTELVVRCNSISSMLYDAARSHYNGIGDSIRANYIGEYRGRAICAAALSMSLGDELDKVFGSDPAFHKAIATAWEHSYTMQENNSFAFVTGEPTSKLPQIGKYDKDFIRSRVQNKVNSLKLQIKKLEEPTEKRGCGGVLFIILGAIFFILAALSTSVGVDVGMVIVEWIVAFALLIPGIIMKVPKNKSPERLAKDRAEIEKLNKQIRELEESAK